MSGFLLKDSEMIRVHLQVQKKMPELLKIRGRWSCRSVSDPTSHFTYRQIKFDEGMESDKRGVQIGNKRYLVVINSFAPSSLEQYLHDHRGSFASLHFHPDLPRGTLVSRHEWNLDGGERVQTRDFTIGDLYAIENYSGFFHRVKPIVESYTLLVGLIADNPRKITSVNGPERVSFASQIIEDAMLSLRIKFFNYGIINGELSFYERSP